MFLKNVFSVFLMLLVLYSCGNEEKADKSNDKEMLIMGVSADYPPFEFIKSKKVVGFDIDLANQIAKKLGVKLYIKEMNWDSLIPALHSGRVDFVMSAMSKTSDRAKNVDFSIPYYAPSLAILYKKSAPIKDVSLFDNKEIAVQLGSTMESFIRKQSKKYKIDIISLTRVPTMVQELKLGRVDAVLIEEAQAKEFVLRDQNLDYSLASDNDGEYSVAFPKNSDLKSRFDEALVAIRDSGELDKIKSKWLS
ncbi:MAG: ABC transporter substrate-binding protein [Rickettsiales bacterium]